MLLEEAPEPRAVGLDPRPHHVIATSARALVSLKSNKKRLLEFLTSSPGAIKLADLAYTTTSRRLHHGFRTAYSVSNMTDLIKLITKEVAPESSSNEPSRTVNPPSVVFIFTGQGSHYAGMAKTLFHTSSTFRNNIAEYDDICVRQGQTSFLPWILDSNSDIHNMAPAQLQLGLVALELSLANLWQSWGLKPDVVIGHSLGEYPALCVAGVLSVTDMFYLVIRRAEILQQKCSAYTHSMLAIGASTERLSAVLESDFESCEVACVNSPDSTVISGSAEDINNLKDRMDRDGIKSTLLKVPFAFHSSQIDPILSEFEAVAQNAHFAKPAVPVASSLTGSLVSTEGVFSANYLASQTRNKVNFLGALKACRSSGITDEKTLWIENGPSPVCLGMVRATIQLPSANSLPSMRPNEDVWKTISNGIANAYNSGSDVSWYNYHREYEAVLRPVRLPAYSFDLKNYWIQNEGRFNNAKNENASNMIAAPTFSTTCLQRIESETFGPQGASVTFVSEAAEENLFAAIQGHLVDGVGLCPSSVYSDMAFTAASYIHSKIKPSIPVPAMDVANMEVFHPLVVVSNKSRQLIRIAASWSIGSDTTEIRFSSQEGTESTDHGKCIVRYGDGNEWKTEWSRVAYLVQSRVDALVESAKVGLTHRILRPMVYKLFSALVVYDKKYQGLTDVFMDSTLHEASACINFEKTSTSTSATGTFTYSPYWIDSIVHLAGFVLNGHFTTPEDKVFISHGWKSLRIAVGKLDEGRSYSSYVRMQPVAGTKGVMAGDVYLFDGKEVIAMCHGLKFQELKKTILHSLLTRSSNAATMSGQKTVTTSHAREPNNVSHEKVSRGLTKPSKATVGPTAATTTKLQTDSAPRGSLYSKVLDIIAAEVKLDRDEFTDEAEFTELGIDSLLTISIMSSLQAKLALTLPTSIFTAYPTVAALRTLIQQEFATTEEDAEYDSTNSGLSCSENNNDNLSTPRSELSPIDSPDVAEVFMSAVAAETGIHPSEIEPSTLFSELGVESLMSIAVLSTVKDRTGVMLPTSFLIDNPTVAEARKALRNNDPAPPQSCPRPGTLKTALEKEVNVRKNNSCGSAKKYSSKAVFIQGRLSSGLTPLIFIADGAGSAASYINIPSFPSGQPVYALESPFLHCPLEYNLSFEAVATIYVGFFPHSPSSLPE